jgi:hypothetical protein
MRDDQRGSLEKSAQYGQRELASDHLRGFSMAGHFKPNDLLLGGRSTNPSGEDRPPMAFSPGCDRGMDSAARTVSGTDP